MEYFVAMKYFGILVVIGYTPREEVVVSRFRAENSNCRIHLFTTISNKALEDRVDTVNFFDPNNLQETLVRPIKKIKPDLVFIGPDVFSSLGVKDALKDLDSCVLGANSTQIRIKSDKSLIRSENSPLRQFLPCTKVLTSYSEGEVLSFQELFPKFMIKYPGIYKEVGGGSKAFPKDFQTIKEVLSFIRFSIENCGCVVLEEFVEGDDFSVNAIAGIDGKVAFLQDNYCYKRRDNDDEGPNTSGTGSYASGNGLELLLQAEKEQSHNIVKESVLWLNSFSGSDYIGGLNVDFRKARNGKIFLLEINCRFAGAGTLSTIISLLDCNLQEALISCANGSAPETLPTRKGFSSLGVFAYPCVWPYAEPDSENHVRLPKLFDKNSDVELFTGWIEPLFEDDRFRLVILKNSTTLLFHRCSESKVDNRSFLYSQLAQLPKELTYRTDIGKLSWMI
jgi:phosphoribosylamine---glycine ligase